MMHPYHCDSCGCYMDPGEGHTCDECQKKESDYRKLNQSVQDTIQLTEGWQYELTLDGGYLYGEH
ncbi:hypothetical protein CLFS41_52830 [Clostridium sp. FS41]|nr:hypothetical protein CLFS41_52830 [Clostridium sp. FS41]